MARKRPRYGATIVVAALVGTIDVVGDISPRPLLLIHGAEDEIVPPSHRERLYERAGEPKELWIAPGSGHVVIVNDHPEEYRRRVIGFFDRWLRGTPGR